MSTPTPRGAHQTRRPRPLPAEQVKPTARDPRGELDYRGPGNQPPGQHLHCYEKPPDPGRFTYPVAEPTRAGRSQSQRSHDMALGPPPDEKMEKPPTMENLLAPEDRSARRPSFSRRRAHGGPGKKPGWRGYFSGAAPAGHKPNSKEQTNEQPIPPQP